MAPSKVTFASRLVWLAISAACAAAPPAAAPTRVAPVAAPASARARWVLPKPELALGAKLDLGGGQTLFVDHFGARATAEGDGPLTEAPTLALESLVGVLREGTDFAFVAADGDVYVSHEALGALDGAVRNGPLGEPIDEFQDPKLAAVATGRSAILGLTQSGRLLRSADYGRHWAPVSYAGPGTYGRAASVALDTHGNGLLLLFPQRVLDTHDDGASWAPIPTPSIGAELVIQDSADRLFLVAGELKAKLEGSKLVTTQEPFVPLRTPKSGARLPTSNATPPRTLLTGNRVVEFTFQKGPRPSVAVTSHALGDPSPPGPRDPASGTSDLVSARTLDRYLDDSGVSSNVAGWGSSLLYARADDVKDGDGAVTTTLLRSSDYGATWATDAVLKGHVFDSGSDHDTRDLALGPNGWAYLTVVCPPNAETTSAAGCSHRQIRPAGFLAFEDLRAADAFVPLRFAFDETRGRVYALGTYENTLHVYASPLGMNEFTRLKLLDEKKADADSAALSVDPSGTLRVLVYDYLYGQWRLLRQDAAGNALPVLYLPTGQGGSALVGLRGLITADHRSWETADGGESWVRVAAPGRSRLACTEAGCTASMPVVGRVERVGWELPAYEGTEKLAATAEPKDILAALSSPTPTTATAPPALQITCKRSGAPMPISVAAPGADSVDVRASDVRWTELRSGDDKKISVVIGGRASDREVTLQGPEPIPKPDVPPTVLARTYVFPQPEGIVAVRAVQALPVDPTTPVAIDVASFAAATGKVVHRTPRKIPPFSLQSHGFGEAHLVDGGVVLQTDIGEPVHWVQFSS